VSLEEEQARPDSLYHWYRKLLALRHARPELHAGAQRILCDDASSVLCILREDGSRRTLLMVNLGDTAARPVLDGSAIDTASWSDLLNGGAAQPLDRVLQPMEVRAIGTR
jgi:glycosidase